MGYCEINRSDPFFSLSVIVCCARGLGFFPRSDMGCQRPTGGQPAGESHSLLARKFVRHRGRAPVGAGQRVRHWGDARRDGVLGRSFRSFWRGRLLQKRKVRHEVRLRQRLGEQCVGGRGGRQVRLYWHRGGLVPHADRGHGLQQDGDLEGHISRPGDPKRRTVPERLRCGESTGAGDGDDEGGTCLRRTAAGPARSRGRRASMGDRRKTG